MDKRKEEARLRLGWYVRDAIDKEGDSKESILTIGLRLGALLGRTDDHFDDTTPYDDCSAEDIFFVYNALVDTIRDEEDK